MCAAARVLHGITKVSGAHLFAETAIYAKFCGGAKASLRKYGTSSGVRLQETQSLTVFTCALPAIALVCRKKRQPAAKSFGAGHLQEPTLFKRATSL